MSESRNPFPWHHWPQQSPINLVKGESLQVKFPKSFLKCDYRDSPFTGQFEGEEGHNNFVLSKPHCGKNPPIVTFGSMQAELVKIHLRTPSEHDCEGKDLDGEIHLIHKIVNPTAGSELLVIGVFFDRGASIVNTDFFSSWSAHLGKGQSAKTIDEEIVIDPRKLLPKSVDWYHYQGSLTSEPYSENVSWLVLVEPIGIGSADLKKLKANAHQPERSVQPINRRFVIRNFT